LGWLQQACHPHWPKISSSSDVFSSFEWQSEGARAGVQHLEVQLSQLLLYIDNRVSGGVVLEK
jgi:hypothetical protein